jgi:hypothetical protein
VKAGDLVRFRKNYGADVFDGQPGLVLRVWKRQGWRDLQAEVLWSSGSKWSQSIKLLEVINGD